MTFHWTNDLKIKAHQLVVQISPTDLPHAQPYGKRTQAWESRHSGIDWRPSSPPTISIRAVKSLLSGDVNSEQVKTLQERIQTHVGEAAQLSKKRSPPPTGEGVIRLASLQRQIERKIPRKSSVRTSSLRFFNSKARKDTDESAVTGSLHNDCVRYAKIRSIWDEPPVESERWNEFRTSFQTWLP